MGGGRVAVFVDPAARRRGIGRQLWGALEAALRAGGARQVFSRYDTGSSGFFHRRGFAHVVHLHIMGYTGPAFPEPTLDAKLYSDQVFADYLRINNEAFHDLRRDAGLEPNVFADAAFADDVLSRKIEADAANIWMAMDGDKPIGVVKVEGPLIDTIALRPDWQGRGLGGALTRFAVNRLKERGVAEVLLDVGAPNMRARRLYERLGFTTKLIWEVGRLSIGGDWPAR